MYHLTVASGCAMDQGQETRILGGRASRSLCRQKGADKLRLKDAAYPGAFCPEIQFLICPSEVMIISHLRLLVDVPNLGASWIRLREQ
jgi:hypothetical protein